MQGCIGVVGEQLLSKEVAVTNIFEKVKTQFQAKKDIGEAIYFCFLPSLSTWMTVSA